MHFDTKKLTRCALIAAVYVALTMLSNVLNLAFGPIQLRFSEALADLFIVSKVELEEGEALHVKVDNAAGTKCPRCWKHSLEANAEGLCPRCAKATSELNRFCEEVKELL